MDSPDFLIDTDIRKLLSVIDHPRDEAIVVLVLSTGLFLSELIALDLQSIDFEAKTINVVGKRERTIELTDTAAKALAKYLEHRPKTPEGALFVTERGVPKRLSERSIDHIIRTAAKASDLDVNYHALRNTFIVRCLKKNDEKTTAKLLGVDREALARFAPITRPESSPRTQGEINDDPMDTRSSLRKLVDVVHPKTPVNPIEAPQPLENRTTIGRDKLLKKATDLIHNQQSVLFTGPPGIGKTHLLNHLAETTPNSIWITSPVPFKTMLLDIAKTVCPSESLTQRTTTPDIVTAILDADTLIPPVLIIDNLDRLKASEEDTMKTLIDRFPIVAAIETVPDRLQGICWKFQEIEVDPLNPDATKALIKHLTQTHSMNPDDYTLLQTKVLNLANGNPFAIVELISQLPPNKKITADHIRTIDHEAGIVYRDWTGALMIIWGLLVISRFIALGTHSFEGYILAGIGTSVFMTFKYFVKLKR